MHFFPEVVHDGLVKNNLKVASEKIYVGRYAPSPSGRMHYGNLRTALLSWLHARLNKGKWLLRFDDLDTPRVVEGSDEQILEDLTWLGLNWDDEPYYQSQHLDKYEKILKVLDDKGYCYQCYCSRKDIQEAISAPHGKTSVYPGTCRDLSDADRQEKNKNKDPSIRIKVDPLSIIFEDGILGEQQQSLVYDCGDFVIKRADNLFAYQFSVVIDDIAQGVTDVVRGADLLDSCARQIFLFNLLHSRTPKFWHMPLLNDESGRRMSKRDGSLSLAEWQQSSLSAEALIGKFVNSLGLLPDMGNIESISARDLLELMTLEKFHQCLTTVGET